MSRLPSLTPREVVAALKKAGFEERRQRGSHLFLRHPERNVLTTVPMHASDLPRGTLKAVIRQAGFTEDEFNALL
jgi:predicted RNA binding protein YcfA (HicA-like mRNA interferase family)